MELPPFRRRHGAVEMEQVVDLHVLPHPALTRCHADKALKAAKLRRSVKPNEALHEASARS